MLLNFFFRLLWTEPVYHVGQMLSIADGFAKATNSFSPLFCGKDVLTQEAHRD